MDMNNDIKSLQNLGIFSTLPDDLIEDIGSYLEERVYSSGSEILHRGDTGRALYIILSGNVMIEMPKDKSIPLPLANLGPGDIFGEISLLSGQPATATVVADGDVELILLPKDKLLQMFEKHPPLARHIVTLLANRLSSTDMAIPNFTDEKKLILQRFLEQNMGRGKTPPE
ncbi:MAG: cyclic nucleotide-binding domain-containing protein [Chloroflexi bacterium]|nr:cyclic nucleotide-binding domain-containing protein [Chloroflexota bacterium]